MRVSSVLVVLLPHFNRVGSAVVELAGNPSEVLHGVVGLVVVYVINLLKVLRIRYEGLRYKSMNCSWPYLPIALKQDVKITSFSVQIHPHWSTLSSPVPVVGYYAPKV